MAPPAKFVPDQINDLLNWYSTSQLQPLIRSAVFHYEFEFIHPFADGNGRMGRMWHRLNVMGNESLPLIEIMRRLNLSHKPTFRKNYLLPALNLQLIEMTIPDKPNSRNQKYRKRT